MKKILLIISSVLSMNAFADVYKTVECINETKSSALTISFYEDFAPGSRILFAATVARFTVNPDGTGRIEGETEDALIGQARIFDTIEDAKTHISRKTVNLLDHNSNKLKLKLKRGQLVDLETKEVYLCK